MSNRLLTHFDDAVDPLSKTPGFKAARVTVTAEAPHESVHAIEQAAIEGAAHEVSGTS